MTKYKPLSTYERLTVDPKRKTAIERGYKELLLSELFLAMKEGDTRSVRALAKEIGVSPSVIQNISSGKQKDIKLDNFLSMVSTFGYQVVLEKGEKRIPL